MQPAQLGLRVQRVLKASKVHLDQPDLPDKQDHLDNRDLQDSPEQQVPRGLLGPQVIGGFREERAQPDRWDLLEILVPLDQRVLPEEMEVPDHLD